ncbi:MAG: nickel-dependent hydrogenase large subunit [Methanobacteriota archaeon]
MVTVTIEPNTRIEGHMGIKAELDATNVVTDAKCTGAMFRGIESILKGRAPRDAEILTQRICGVCPISHGTAAALCLENAGGTTIPANGRIMRNLIQSANYIQSHILHFYHLAALDYVKGPAMPPWTPFWDTDYRLTAADNDAIVANYRKAITMRRKAHEMDAIFGGKLPHAPAVVAGGCAEDPDVEYAGGISKFGTYLDELITFIDNTYLPDVDKIATAYSDYNNIGVGCKNLLSYGVFDTDGAGTLLLKRGRIENAGTTVNPVDQTLIKEYVKYSYYPDADTGLHPSAGVTNPLYGKAGAYSWLKAPRYDGRVYEVGPLARMWVNGDYRTGIGVMHRHAARAKEAQKVAYAMKNWLTQIVTGNPYFVKPNVPAEAKGVGLTEAPRGALGHWETISASLISRYQCVVPTTWNASPMDDAGVRGPIEQALMGTKVADPARPIELLRIVHSFDPCIACAVHVLTPPKQRGLKVKVR